MIALADVQKYPYYYEIIKNLTLRDIKVKYKRSSLGFLWTLLNPLCTAGIYIFVFSQIMRPGIPDYWAFLLSGFFSWNFFAMSLTSGADVISANRSIVTRVAFPHEILVVSNTVSKLVEFFFELLILIPLISVFYLQRVPAAIAVLPLLVIIQIIMTIGVVLPMACLKVFYKDVDQVLPILVTAWFFLTPVVYTEKMVPPGIGPILALNPMRGIISAYHDVLYYGRFPDPYGLLATTVAALVIFVVGYWIFNHYKSIFTEIV